MAAEELKARRFVIATSSGAYDVLIEKQSAHEFRIVVPDLPECVGRADSFDAALASARATIERCTREMRDAGRSVPKPGAALNV